MFFRTTSLERLTQQGSERNEYFMDLEKWLDFGQKEVQSPNPYKLARKMRIFTDRVIWQGHAAFATRSDARLFA